MDNYRLANESHITTGSLAPYAHWGCQSSHRPNRFALGGNAGAGACAE